MKFKTVDEAVTALKKGSLVTIVANTANHGFPTGAVLTVSGNAKRVAGYHNRFSLACEGYGAAYSVNLSDVEGASITVEELEKEVEELNSQIEVAKTKMEYLKKTKQEVFDPVQFQVWNTLQVLKTKKSDVEKAKIIAELIKN